VPLVYKAQDSWFIDIQSIKPRLLSANEQINRYPDHFKYGRFAKNIESAPDWGISRSRYWGTPMPVYVPETELSEGMIDPEHAMVIGSREELYQRQLQ
jgi:isoleucyl-tRNA synthetase